MTDYGHDLLFGSFLTASTRLPSHAVELGVLSEAAGLDLVTLPDHPYVPGMLDTSTVLSYLAARTSRVRLAANVTNLPLRPPAVLARSAASLDLLSSGRFELGLGSGADWNGIEAMGGPRLDARDAVAALSEAITLIRQLWAVDDDGDVHFDGTFHRTAGAVRGPRPAHDISIWLGAYKPQMLTLVGRAADGWLPSLGYLGAGDLAAGNARIDDAAESAGRAPSSVRRLLNISGTFSSSHRGRLNGPPEQWVDEIAALALDDGVSAFILATDDPTQLRTFASQVAPAVRSLVEAERRTDRSVPDAPLPGDAGRHLVDMHDGLRSQLEDLNALIASVAETVREVPASTSLEFRKAELARYCRVFCRTLSAHHSIEDTQMFPALRQADPTLGAVLDRLVREHQAIHIAILDVESELQRFRADDVDLDGLRAVLWVLHDLLLSHLEHEERELVAVSSVSAAGQAQHRVDLNAEHVQPEQRIQEN